MRQAIGWGQHEISFQLAERAIRNLVAAAECDGHDRIPVKFLGREPLLNWKVFGGLLEKVGVRAHLVISGSFWACRGL